ncbi:MFS transporter [Arthrobacter sp. BE255]|uniref:MFS transporter n=1 Tax=Arthrobacter sp. BE255 TaxID=2817721 RepID=UPI00285698F9|nr:MFS transporter [Arthrobacter sp. BE255]MDR7161627.1 MFS family permease [Arthrobacter sp. BE255]
MKQPLHKQPEHAAATPPLRRNRDFLLAGSARFVATAGLGAVVVTVMLHLHDLGASGVAPVAGPWLVAAYLLCSALPLVLLAPWAGRLADTRDSRTLATASSVVSAAAVAGMGLGMAYLDHYLPVLFAMTILLDAAQAVAGPTWQALLPRIVGEDRTPRAMGTMQATVMIAGMAGPAAGGLLSGWGGSTLVFAVASGCYLAMGAGALLIRTRRGTAAELAGTAKPALLDGLRLIRRDSLVWAIVLGALFFVTVAEAVSVLEVFLARGELGATETEYGLLAAAFALGMASGAALSSRIRNGIPRLRALLAAMALTAVFLGTMGLVPDVGMLFAATTAMGVACGAMNACFGTIVILRVPEGGRGQALAIIGGLARAVTIAALALGGVLGALLPVRAGLLMVASAGLLVALGVAAYVWPRYGRPAAGAVRPQAPAAGGSGGQQEPVAHQVRHVGEQPAPERAAVEPVLP